MKKYYNDTIDRKETSAAYKRVRTLIKKFPGYTIGLGYRIQYYGDEHMPEKYVCVCDDWENFIDWVSDRDNQHPGCEDARSVSQIHSYDDRWSFTWDTVEVMMIRIQNFAKKWYKHKQEWDRKNNGCVSETSRLDTEISL